MSFNMKFYISLVLLCMAYSQTYFQIIPQLSFYSPNKSNIQNYTLSPEFELENKKIVFNHKVNDENPTGSIITKFPIYVPDFELQITMKLASKASDGVLFGIFFLNDYKGDTFDFSSTFNGFALIFTTTPILYSMEDRTVMSVRLIKNLKNSTVEDLLYSNDFVEGECKDKFIVGQKFKFFARYKEGSLRSHFDSSEDLFNSCVRKPVMDFEKNQLRIAFLTYEGKNFLPDENKKLNIFDIKNDVEIYRIRVMNMKLDYRNRFSPAENFTIIENFRLRFDDDELFKRANQKMRKIYDKVIVMRDDADDGFIKPENKTHYEKGIVESMEMINEAVDDVLKVFKLEKEKPKTNNITETIENIFDFYREAYHKYMENGVDIDKLEEIRSNFDKYRNSLLYLDVVREALDKLNPQNKTASEKAKSDL